MKSVSLFFKNAVKRYNSTSLIMRILIGMVIGIILALLVPSWTWIGEFGSLFVGALKGTAPVLVFVLVASSLAQNKSSLDKRFGTVIFLYMLTTFLAAVLAVFTSEMFPQTIALGAAVEDAAAPQGLGDVFHTLLANIVTNPVDSIANGNYIGILFYAVLFGFAMKKCAGESATDSLRQRSTRG